MADLKESEKEAADMAYDIYRGMDAELDAYLLGPALRGLKLNPSLEWLKKNGATERKGEKFLKLEEFYKAFSECKKDKKDQGVYEDFIECLKLYDKAGDGKMMAAELSHALLSLGEKMQDADVDQLLTDCLDEEDDDGMIPYVPFLARMCDKPVPNA